MFEYIYLNIQKGRLRPKKNQTGRSVPVVNTAVITTVTTTTSDVRQVGS
jgi:hypothetical protein